ncbi:3-deoxy-7-phosphoheptulonate synthase [Chitinimonas sp.]|uniref:3-deoxy-7-phosphoheptulonate synthase n=1 Tax=Chitinimonas sp. TaxID=1934313 RepID=UPI0035ADE9EA
MLTSLSSWTPDSWASRQQSHMPAYHDDAEADAVLARLSAYPALVSVAEIRELRDQLARAALGQALVIQAGDCAEQFEGLRPAVLTAHYQLLGSMAEQLQLGTGLPVLCLGRIAGQYAKPRSQAEETRAGLSLPSYRGDIINGSRFDAATRRPDPARMEQAYFHAAASLNYLRSLERSGAEREGRYFTSHEALLLPYEQAALLRGDDGLWYGGSGHFLWVGERTRQLDSAHIEFVRGIQNPIGIKIGPNIEPATLLALIALLDPDNIPGRLTLIVRMGRRAIEQLPMLLAAVRDAGRQPLWLCDPMHGNGVVTDGGIKTRRYDDIAAEIQGFIAAHRQCATHAGGVHLELSGESVTECLGGPEGLDERDLGRAYLTACDPRLNPAQAQALARTLIDGLGMAAAAPEQINLTERLIATRRNCDRTSFCGPGFRLSYRELDRVVRRQAAWMARSGAKPGERVLIALNDGPELLATFFAALALGALPVVVNPRLDSAAIAQLLADARPVLCFADSAQAALWPVTPTLHCLDADAHLDWLGDAHPDDAWDDFVYQSVEAPILIQYTSGSTGLPKGVVHSARSVLAACEHFAAGQLGLAETDILYSVPKSFFGYGMGNSLFFPLHLGACALLDSQWPSLERVRALLRQYQPTVLFAVPALYRMLLDEDIDGSELSVRLAFSAGAPLPPAIASRWRERFGVDLHDGIGATEMCHVFATSYPDAVQPGKVGRMLPGWEARIVNADGLPVADGEYGVLLVKSPSMALGYWERPQDQAARFVDGWYRTGDLFSQDSDGMLTFHGREDDRFKVNGRWVVPVEIENLLGNLLPEVNECYLVPGSDRDGELRPVLFVRGAVAGDALVRLVRATLEAHLESYKRPQRIAVLAELPLNRNGKPDRRALSKQAGVLLCSQSEMQPC